MKNNYFEVFSEHCLKGNVLPFANVQGLPKISSKKCVKNKTF